MSVTSDDSANPVKINRNILTSLLLGIDFFKKLIVLIHNQLFLDSTKKFLNLNYDYFSTKWI